MTGATRQAGLTMLELAFVLVVLGILASTLIPAIHAMHEKSMQEEDRKIATTLKEAIIGQFLATGALPACKDAAGNPSMGNCDTQQSLGILAVRLGDARNTPVKYDVWNVTGSDLTATDKTTACATLDAAIASAAAYPEICGGVPDYDAPSTPYCTSTQRVAFVLVATGRNRPGQSGENGNSVWTVGGTNCPPNRNIDTTGRVFERPERRPYAPCYYDDIVDVITLQELKTKAGCPL